MLTLAKPTARTPHHDAALSADRRADRRYQTTYRPCCLISQKVVSIGIIRNFSESGACIETDRDLQVGELVSYFWEAKTCIKARVVWCDGRRFGLAHVDPTTRFDCDLPSRSVRVPCSAEAICWVQGDLHCVEVANISIGGMRLAGLPQLDVGTLMTVRFCGLEIHSASVRWSSNGVVGVRFANPLTREQLATLLLDQRFCISGIEFER